MEQLYSPEFHYKNNFDFTRVLLATTVVFCHCIVTLYDSAGYDPLWYLSKHQLTTGTCAVNFFFAISGFLVSQSWERSQGYFSFLLKRALRIFPAFIVVCFICAFVVAPLGLHNKAGIPAYWSAIGLRHLVLTTLTLREPVLPETFNTVPLPHLVNAALWSIPFEFVCYQAIPIFALLGALRKVKWALAVFLLVLAVNLLHTDVYSHYVATSKIKYDLVPYYPQRFAEELVGFEHIFLPFVSGVFFYTCRQYIPRSPYLAVLSGVSLLIGARCAPYFEIIQAVAGTYLLFYFIFNKQITFHHFARYGDFSYGIYLYGWPVQQLILLYTNGKINIFIFFILTMSILVVAAAISWHFVEEPFLRLRRFFLPRQMQVAPLAQV